MGGFEREDAETGAARHVLCKSGSPVPSTVPRGVPYQPHDADFRRRDADAGWRCLRIQIFEPIHCQYSYRSGSGYKGPARGLPDPGPNGFEAAAECDFAGDGRTRLFTWTGTIRGDLLVVESAIAGLPEGG